MFDDNLRVMSVALFVPDFNLLSCKFDNFILLQCVIESFYINTR